MNKRELITRVQRLMGPGTTRRTAAAALEAVLGSIPSLATQQRGLTIRGFGRFCRATDGKLHFRAARRLLPEQAWQARDSR